MNRQIVRAVLVAAGVLCFAGPSAAQFYGWGGYGGYDGSAALLGADSRQVRAMQMRSPKTGRPDSRPHRTKTTSCKAASATPCPARPKAATRRS